RRCRTRAWSKQENGLAPKSRWTTERRNGAMAQLAGSECVICHDRISGVLSARFCEQCGNPVHKDCQEKLDAATVPTGRCPQCGGDPAAAPRATNLQSFNPAPLMVVAATLLLAFLAYFFWPAGSASDVALASASEPASQDQSKSKEKLPVVEIETTEGTIKARLFTDKAPKTAENFIDLVKQEY